MNKETHTHVRLRRSTKAKLRRFANILTTAYVEGRSMAPIRDPDHGVSDDEALNRALDIAMGERERKNQPKRLRRRTAHTTAAVLTPASNHSNGAQQ